MSVRVAINGFGRLDRAVGHEDAVARGDHGADVVIESTGRFRTREDAGRHPRSGAREVLLSVPAPPLTADEANAAFREAADGPLRLPDLTEYVAARPAHA
jgi:glyceraldehyde-3-phosphate dehydrogenase/erythrose-4-phosphate dehydrogenase